MTRAKLTITPPDALIDVPRTIRIEQLVPETVVIITATTLRGNGTLWQSRARFQADSEGVVDLSLHAPLDGSYSDVSAMGMIWSQTPAEEGECEVFPLNVLSPLETNIRVAYDDRVLQGKFTQRLASEGVQRIEIREAGLVGTLFVPASAGPHPAIMIMNGSGGGINEPRAALYASHGYLAFALAYFKAPGLSDYISNTPLEYFKKGLDWLRKTHKPYKDFVAINGQSRGGELVLMLGSLFPDDVSAVVAYVPAALVHSGQNAADPKVGRDGPAWLLNGQEIPHLWKNNKTATWAPFDEGPSPHRHEKAILTALQDKEAVERSRIRVENIKGPVILLSATDDGSWPSSLYSKMVYDRLKEVNFSYDVHWIDTQDAGHSIVFPYVPTTQLVYTHPVSGKISTGGGRADANAESDERTWTGIKKFLAEAVRNHGRMQHDEDANKDNVSNSK